MLFRSCDRLLQSTHGPSLLTIAQLWHNENEALALLQLPDFMQSESSDYLLHPSMLNGAILSSVVFSLLKHPSEQLPVPFALDRLWIFKKIPQRAYAYVSLSSANKHNIELVDEQGERIVLLEGFTASFQRQSQGSSNISQNPTTSNVIYGSSQWQNSSLSGDNFGEKIVSSSMATPIFILTEENSRLKQLLQQRWPAATLETLASVGQDSEDKAATVEKNFLAIFQRIKNCIISKPKLNQPIVILVPQSENAYLYNGFAALLKTAQFENGKIVGKLIRYEIDDRTQKFIDIIAAEIEYSSQDVEVLYDATGTRKIKQLKEIGRAHV